MRSTFLLALTVSLISTASLSAADRPNILWLTSEDNGPHLGCYGDEYATTPNLDGLAARGQLYLNAWSTAPVCAPARTTIISGVYPPSTGSEHMRSQTRLPASMKMFPAYLRAAGYYCTNSSKEDYNLKKEGEVWHESSRKAHYRNRDENQPFFAVFNYTVSHESQIRKRPHAPVHDPAKVRVPAYHPDRPEVRQDWAQYYDKLTEMDAQIGRRLAELKDAGLADDTIIFYYGDHGSGMPRSKRWPYNSGLNVPWIVHVPEKYADLAPKGYAAGAESDRLVGFIDLAPTVLSIVGLEPPKHMQGHAFMGKYATPDPEFAFAFRGRMDERYDLVRSMRDQRYVYIRNFMPHKIYGQHIAYMFQTPTTRVWKQLFDEGKLNEAQSTFWRPKAPEELYDLENDPDEVNNLATSRAHAGVLARFRTAQRRFLEQTRDIGFLPEDEIHSRSKGSTPYEMGQNPSEYDISRVISAADVASRLNPLDSGRLQRWLTSSPDSAVRYWAALGLLMRGTDCVANSESSLLGALEDDSESVRVIAAQALGQYSTKAEQRERAAKLLVEHANLDRHSSFVSILALNALDHIGDVAKPFVSQIEALPKKPKKASPRVGGYAPNLIRKTLADLR